MKDPLGYKVLARRLYRDLDAVLLAEDQADHDGIDQSEWKRIVRRARNTLKRFEEYEKHHTKAR